MTATFADLPAATKLAIDRTRLAYERTLMAWVRTSASMISFGFTIYKALQFLREQATAPPARGITPRELGIGMMAFGLIALAIATIQHLRSLRALKSEYGIALPTSVSAVVSGVLAVFGIIGLVAAYLRY
jgi:putative membrane protein